MGFPYLLPLQAIPPGSTTPSVTPANPTPPPTSTTSQSSGSGYKLNSIFFDASFGNRGWISGIAAASLSPRGLFTETSTYQIGFGFSLKTPDNYYPYFRFQYGDSKTDGAPNATFNRWRIEAGLEEFGDLRWFPRGGPFFIGLGNYHRLGFTLGTSFVTDVQKGGKTDGGPGGHVVRPGVTNDRDLVSVGAVGANRAFELGLGLYLPAFNSRESLLNFGGGRACPGLRCELSEFQSGTVYTPLRFTARYFHNGIPGEYAPNSKQAVAIALMDNAITAFGNFQQRRSLTIPLVNAMAAQLLFSFGNRETYDTLHTGVGGIAMLEGVQEAFRQRDIALVVRYGTRLQLALLGVHEGAWLLASSIGGATRDSNYPSKSALMNGTPGIFGDRDRRALRAGAPVQASTLVVGVLDGVGAFGGEKRPWWADIIFVGVGIPLVLYAGPIAGNGVVGEGDPTRPRSLLRNSGFSDGGIYFEEKRDIAGEDFLGRKEFRASVTAIGSSLIFNGAAHLFDLARRSLKGNSGPKKTASLTNTEPYFEFGGTWAGGRNLMLNFALKGW
jgi:hypothetical protein